VDRFGNGKPLTLGPSRAPNAFLYSARIPGLPSHCLSLRFPLGANRVVAWVTLDSVMTIREPLLASVLALFHETFHAYQAQRFAATAGARPDWTFHALEEAIAIPDSIVHSAAFRDLAAQERALLASALETTLAVDSVRTLLRRYVSLRGERMAILPVSLRGAEPHQERKEGSAQFVGITSAFAALGRSKEDLVAAVRRDLLETPPLNTAWGPDGPYRNWHIYATGAAIGLLLDRVGVPWREELQGGQTFIGILSRAVEGA